MNFVKPSVEIITEPDLFKRIEIGARNCWQSFDKCGPGSDIDIFKKLVARGHESALEHSNIVVVCDSVAMTEMVALVDGYLHKTGKPNVLRQSMDPELGLLCHVWSGNLRAWRDICRYNKGSALLYSLFHNHPGFEDIELTDGHTNGKAAFCNGYKSDRHSIITAKFVCDRGVSHELVRHRVLSYSQTSTRYVNYKEGLTFIEPWWWPQQETSDTALIRMACQAAEDAYCSLINSGASPQKARCVLPNMLKTEVVVTGTVEQWKTMVLPLRLSKAAHPDIRRLMELFCQQLNWNPDDFRK